MKIYTIEDLSEFSDNFYIIEWQWKKAVSLNINKKYKITNHLQF